MTTSTRPNQSTSNVLRNKVAYADSVKFLGCIKKKIDKFSKKLKEYENQKALCENKEALIVLGNARIGKSSFVNFLIGKRFYSERDRATRKICIKLLNNEKPRATIGHGAECKTKQPKEFGCRRFGIDLWDTPGLTDYRSKEQEISVSYCVSELLSKLKKCKIIITVDAERLYNDNSIRPLCAFLKKIMFMFPDLDRLFKSSSIAFLKVPKDVFDISEEENKSAIEILSDILHAKMDVSIEGCLGSGEARAKQFIEKFVANNTHSAVFKKIHEARVSLIDFDFDPRNSIDDALGQSDWFVPDLNTPIGISDSAIRYLRSSFRVLQTQRDDGEIEIIKNAYIEEINNCEQCIKAGLDKFPKWCVDRNPIYKQRLENVADKIRNCNAIKRLVAILPVITERHNSFDFIDHLANINPDMRERANIPSFRIRQDLISLFRPILKRANIPAIEEDVAEMAIMKASFRIALEVCMFFLRVSLDIHGIAQEKCESKLKDAKEQIEQELSLLDKQIDKMYTLIDNDRLVSVEQCFSLSNIRDLAKDILHKDEQTSFLKRILEKFRSKLGLGVLAGVGVVGLMTMLANAIIGGVIAFVTFLGSVSIGVSSFFMVSLLSIISLAKKVGLDEDSRRMKDKMLHSYEEFDEKKNNIEQRIKCDKDEIQNLLTRFEGLGLSIDATDERNHPLAVEATNIQIGCTREVIKQKLVEILTILDIIYEFFCSPRLREGT